MLKKGQSPLFARLFDLSGLSFLNADQETVASAFETAFSILRKSGLRDEYVYRAALTHNVLLGRHSLRTASMLTEFRAGSCKADLVILNGTSTVYEIKSDRDSLARLDNQIENYRKVFAKICVIAGKEHVQKILQNTPIDIGVMSLTRWNRIHTVREAIEKADQVSPVTIFDSLRMAEARIILRNLNIPEPDVPNTMLYGAMRECFSRLAPAEVHQQMVTTLKRTRNLAELGSLIKELPVPLQPSVLALNKIRRTDHEKLLNALQTPLNEAMTWGNH